MQTSKGYSAAAVEEIGSLKLNCFSFLQNEMIPPRYTSDGININPSIYIEDIPEETKSLAITVEDPDVPHDSFCHWVAWNIPVTRHIKQKENRGVSGINDFGNHCYNGPHPFSITHRYFFKVYALDCMLAIPVSSTKTELKNAMKDHIIALGVLIGKYKKQHPSHSTTSLKTEHNVDEQLKTLLNEKGNCVSMILSAHQDPAIQKFHLAKKIKETCSVLVDKKWTETDQIIAGLKNLQEDVFLHHGDRGIGIYLSEGLSLATTFPFDVTEKIVTGNSFHLKEWLVKEQYAVPYTVLYIDEREIRVYNGKMNQLSEMKNEQLPMFFDEGVEETPINSFFSKSSYPKSLDNQSNEITKENYQVILRKADKLLNSFLKDSGLLLLCGVRKYLYQFASTTIHSDRITGILYGNYNRFTENDFAEMAWPIIKTHLDQQMSVEISEYNEKMAEGFTEEGIAHVWDAVLSDRGTTLLVEKNFEIEGFVDLEEPTRLYLHAPHKPFLFLEDAVDELIKRALDKDLKIVFVDDGMLNRNMRIAMIVKF